jgi:hypothetical protein
MESTYTKIGPEFEIPATYDIGVPCFNSYLITKYRVWQANFLFYMYIPI